MKKLIIIITTLCFAQFVNAQNIEGIWIGKIKLGKSNKEIVFKFDIHKKDDVYETTIDIPTQRVAGLNPKKTTYINKELIIDGSNLGIGYKGVYNTATKVFTGTFKEGVNTIPLTLKQEADEPVIEVKKRPQEPNKPFPYESNDVAFNNIDAGITLAGTVTKPSKGNKHPAVILISGSGPSDRDETFAGHKPFLVLSDYLTKQGILVLRYDDRGTGKSTGDHSNATTYDFALDAKSAINYLKSRSDVDLDRIGIIGHSEGGIIAPLVANMMKNDIAFIISLAGTGIPGSELSLAQSKSLRPFPVPDEAAYENAIREAISIASKKRDPKIIKQQLSKHYQSKIKPILLTAIKSEKQVDQIINQFVEMRATPWSQFFYNYNPAKAYKKVKCDVLALYGTKDTQVLASTNAVALENALKKGKTKRYSVKVLENLNHLFQEAKTGKMSEYETIEQTISPLALNEISTWIHQTINK